MASSKRSALRRTLIFLEVVGIALLLLAAASLFFKKPKSKEAQIRALIEQLNRDDTRGAEALRKLDQCLDQVSNRSAEPERTWDAYDKLGIFGIEAFPILIEHFDDPRPGPPASMSNRTIGGACQFIIIEQLFAFPPGYPEGINRKGADGNFHARAGVWDFSLFDETRGGLKSWMDARKGRSLPELQLEALQWALEQEEKTGVAEEGDDAKYLAPLRRKVEGLRKAVSAQLKP